MFIKIVALAAHILLISISAEAAAEAEAATPAATAAATAAAARGGPLQMHLQAKTTPAAGGPSLLYISF